MSKEMRRIMNILENYHYVFADEAHDTPEEFRKNLHKEVIANYLKEKHGLDFNESDEDYIAALQQGIGHLMALDLSNSELESYSYRSDVPLFKE
jgi:hypothetical protein